MDNLETPYDADVNFIECQICNKSVRGETLYKIHLTTMAHVKREEFLISQGYTVGQQPVPKFNNILELLDYLNLDEPIIGLGFLQELPSDDAPSGIKYSCNLCLAVTYMSEMVHHVIGRKHRQKYVELKRKDLVTWDNQPFSTKGARLIRAKAEIIERQDGRGFPKELAKSTIMIKSNTSKAEPSVTPYGNKRFPPNPDTVQPHLPEFIDYHKKYSNQRNAADLQYPPMVYPGGPNMDRERQFGMNKPFGFHNMVDGPSRAEHIGSHEYREGDMYSHHHGPSDEPFVKDPIREAPFGSGFLPRYDYREEIPHDQDYPSLHYQGKIPFRGTIPERHPPREFFHESDRGQVQHPEYEPKPPNMYSKGENWSRERDNTVNDYMNRSARQDSSEPEPKRRILPSPVEGGDRLCSIIKDYRHQKQVSHQGVPRKEVEATQTNSDIPEMFKQFLPRAPNDDPGKRKRKTRFTDASADEVKMTNEMIRGNYGPFHGNIHNDCRRGDVPRRPESNGPPYSEQYRESQNPLYVESHQKEASHTVFDMLKSVEINTAEEADFLKSKLCDLLRDFKAKGIQKVSQNQGHNSWNRDYPKQEPQQFRQQHERTMSKNLNHGAQNVFFEDDRGRSFNQQGNTPERRQKEFPHSSHNEPRHRSSLEALERTLKSHFDKPQHRTERFEAPLPSRDYKSSGEELYDPFNVEEERSSQRNSRYSSTLEKITSTLLELVSRK